MSGRSGGLNFEDGIVAWLRQLGVDIERSEELDLRGGVDYCLRGLPDLAFPKPIDVQLTFQGGNLAKLETFRNGRTRAGHLALYAVAESGMSARTAALQQRKVARRIVTQPEQFPDEKIGVFLNQRAKYQFFAIDQRIEKLRKRADPERSADRRLEGRIAKLGENGAAEILGHDGATYRLRSGDVADRKLKIMLADPDAYEEPLLGRLVSFVPHETYALSVLLI